MGLNKLYFYKCCKFLVCIYFCAHSMLRVDNMQSPHLLLWIVLFSALQPALDVNASQVTELQD